MSLCVLLFRCSGETLLTLITDILDFSRIEANKLVLSAAVFSLQTVVEAAMEIAGLRAAQKRLQVRDVVVRDALLLL
jgi:signal transduction histidine kinase